MAAAQSRRQAHYPRDRGDWPAQAARLLDVLHRV